MGQSDSSAEAKTRPDKFELNGNKDHPELKGGGGLQKRNSMDGQNISSQDGSITTTSAVDISVKDKESDVKAGCELEERKKPQKRDAVDKESGSSSELSKISLVKTESKNQKKSEEVCHILGKEERKQIIRTQDTQNISFHASPRSKTATGLINVKETESKDKLGCNLDDAKEEENRLKYLMNPNITPSFMAIISPTNTHHRPKRIPLDVNAVPWIKKEEDESSTPIFVPSTRIEVNPVDEGYYEGVSRLGLTDDSRYLSELHTLIRDQLELFSATDDIITSTNAGRRKATVRGKVGLRCVHCAKAVLSHPVGKHTWPAASISFPANIEGIYPVCTQKPKLHFEFCPYMPQEIKSKMYSLTHDCNGNSIARQNLGNSLNSPVGATIYYQVAAKRIGLVNVNGGMRFSRDLKLEPLSFESVCAEVESSHKVNKILPQVPVEAKTDDSTSKLVADDESARVLADAISEKDSNNILGQSHDSKIVTDFVFLLLRQMTICHVGNSDFLSRGKKSAVMQIGFAGFCCRHCVYANPSRVENSCRSFTSAPDNLASAVTNAFYLHLKKCPFTPLPIRKAVVEYKRLHSRQMTLFPHGSQRRLFHMIWARLRAADLSAEEMNRRLKNSPAVVMQQKVIPTYLPYSKSDVAPENVPSNKVTYEKETLETNNQRGESFTVCKDEETCTLLKAAVENTDYAANDNLILGSDRHLVTDFIFFMMRNMKVAHPTTHDFRRGRRNTKLAGICCKHCHDQDISASLTGRSFPSQADNLASSFNTSLYQHMLRCVYVPDNIKRVVQQLKKIHSEQCSQLRFGSQRKFFNLVFERLKAVKIPQFETEFTASETQMDHQLLELGFFRISPVLVECTRCRRIPVSLRAPNSVLAGIFNDYTALIKHKSQCTGNKYSLHRVCGVMSEIMTSNPNVTLDHLKNDKFREIVKRLVGVAASPNIHDFFTSGVVHMLSRMRGLVAQTDYHEDKGIIAEEHQFPVEVDFESIESFFRSWAEDIEGLD
eukprot:CAMPEP_0178930726 /NCGR_PEP_ID=MMETSP0786-20121207/21439_1 /TAXON_ID=186022 /ORGANISM="Thalassionema frauenfeldii, Strain CCMP 1798" /LENGTH=1001 /DNA_ID=CAMNT_0020607373 /DNA_START=19 /DNA_END=3022 /DNA_ORIENTATION=+